MDLLPLHETLTAQSALALKWFAVMVSEIFHFSEIPLLLVLHETKHSMTSKTLVHW